MPILQYYHKKLWIKKQLQTFLAIFEVLYICLLEQAIGQKISFSGYKAPYILYI